MRNMLFSVVCGALAFVWGCGGGTPIVPKAKTTTLADGPSGTIDVRSFGARGDGVDDTAALVAAIQYVNSLRNTAAVLYFPAGKYWINPLHGMKSHVGLRLTASNVEIYGNNAVIGLVPGAERYAEQLKVRPGRTFYWDYFEIRGSNVNVHDLTFNSNDMTNVGGSRGTHGMFWASALNIIGTPEQMQSGNTVHNNKFVNIGGWAVNSAYQSNLTISNNYASHSEGMGCGGQVYGCRITDNVSENALDAHFFSNGYIHPGTQNQDVVIRGNTATGNTNGSGIDVTASWDTVVENNTVSKNANWCILVGKTWGPYKQDGSVLPSQRVTVRNNTCNHNGWYQGWPMNSEILVGEEYAAAWKPGDVVSDITVQGNTITSQNAQGRGVVVGYGASRVTIDANQFSGCGGTAACAYPNKAVIRIEEVGTETLTITNNKDDKKYPATYIQLGDVGPYTISGNDMIVR